VIQDTKQQILVDISSTEQIKAMVAIQGADWTDTDILRVNGLNAETSDWYNSLYKGVSKGFYDYFTKSILEPWAEMRKYKYSNLVVEDKYLLYYRCCDVFVCSKRQPLFSPETRIWLKPSY
jgi:hypothetical protein